ncbi:carboxymuconolactone decarboxylase family protein, partial [Corallococcus praedator]
GIIRSGATPRSTTSHPLVTRRSTALPLEGESAETLHETGATSLEHLGLPTRVRTCPLENGVTQEELVALMAHLAFYAGWPNAMSAISRAKELFGETAT